MGGTGASCDRCGDRFCYGCEPLPREEEKHGLREINTDTPMPECKPAKGSKIKSDGRSTSYYLTTLPEGAFTLNEDGSVSFMIEEYIKYGLNNNFDQGNLAKANHRIGKKEGNTEEYDKNKMHHYVDRL